MCLQGKTRFFRPDNSSAHGTSIADVAPHRVRLIECVDAIKYN
jgi:hypothetical protein